ncbi:ATP-dependent DNA ligase [Candidatus Gottesmanbacteria bacterium]|nr:ATP-dependent DNA ligase [Candidatus Gottesmanbacteria bacterium]
MNFAALSLYLERLEKTTLRNSMVEILAELFGKSTPNDIGKMCYLLQGRVVPLYEAVEFGVADKMMIRAIAKGLDIDPEKVMVEFKKEGDLGKVVEKMKASNKQRRKVIKNGLTINSVYDVLYKVARAGGAGSQEMKINLLADLLKEADPLSSRYIVRITLAKLRLGFSDMTMLDGLSWMLNHSKEYRPVIEKAYNVRPDLADISQTLKQKGIEGLKNVNPKVGTPILMARANRLSSGKDILEKIGRSAIEFKYDGLRLQVHYRKVKSQKSLPRRQAGKVKNEDEIFVKLFSRNLEDLTAMFPDIIEAVKKQIDAREVIFEGEVVAYNPKSGVGVAFQQTMQRRRKYNIEEKAAEIPVRLFTYELLYIEGKNYIHEPYKERKANLKKIIKPGKVIYYAQETIVDNEKVIDKLFGQSIQQGFEGIIAKRLEGVYQAGVRGWNWIKFKRAMSKKLADTFDVLVMGYTKGEGKRTIFGVGQFLTGVYDKKKEKFLTISKIGTGLTDEQFRELKKRVDKLEIAHKPKEYEVEKLLEADVWLRPKLVVEVAADEITRSQIHTAGRVMGPSKSGSAQEVKTPGFALRFPRLERFRDDKNPEDATTVSEVSDMFKLQNTHGH